MRDDDATIRVKTAALPRHSRFLPALAAGGAVLLVLCGGIAGWVLWPRPLVLPPPPPQAIAPPQAAPAPAPPFRIETADEATILGHVADHLTVYRFAANPNIIVLDFPSLRMQ